MASNRHLGRIVALQTLYEWDFRQECHDPSVKIDEILTRNIERYKDTIDDTEFIERVVKGTLESIDDLDGIIRPIAPEWPIEQIARIDRNILRMSLYELTKTQDAPPKVVINEAVELAKAFGGENSSKFINGVLGTAYRQHVGEEPASKQDETKEVKTSTKKVTKKRATSKPN